MEWCYAKDGQQSGPVTFEQLVALARSGELTGRDVVWNANMQNWTLAGQVPGIFDLHASSEIPVPEPPNSSNTSNPYAAPQSNWSGNYTSAELALTEILAGSALIDPMDCISRGYEIFKRQFANILLTALVYFACLIGLSLLFGMGELLVTMMASPGNGSTSEPSNTSLVVTVISQIVQQVVSIFLQLGLARIGLNLISGKDVSIGMLFGGGSKLLRAIGATIVLGIAVLIGLVLLIVPGIYIALRYGQVINAIVDRDLGIMEAFSYSESITTNNRMNLFVLALLALIGLIIGLIPCGLGLLIVGPVIWLASLVAYRWLQYGPDAAKDHPGTQTPMLNGMQSMLHNNPGHESI